MTAACPAVNNLAWEQPKIWRMLKEWDRQRNKKSFCPSIAIRVKGMNAQRTCYRGGLLRWQARLCIPSLPAVIEQATL